jgi:hypothetical protein
MEWFSTCNSCCRHICRQLHLHIYSLRVHLMLAFLPLACFPLHFSLVHNISPSQLTITRDQGGTSFHTPSKMATLSPRRVGHSHHKDWRQHINSYIFMIQDCNNPSTVACHACTHLVKMTIPSVATHSNRSGIVTTDSKDLEGYLTLLKQVTIAS